MPSGTETLAKQCERVPRDAATPRGATKLEMKRLSRSGAALRARAHRAHHEAQHESQPTQLTPQTIASIVNLPPGDVLATKLHPRKSTRREISRVHRVTVEPGIRRLHKDNAIGRTAGWMVQHQLHLNLASIRVICRETELGNYPESAI